MALIAAARPSPNVSLTAARIRVRPRLRIIDDRPLAMSWDSTFCSRALLLTEIDRKRKTKGPGQIQIQRSPMCGYGIRAETAAGEKLPNLPNVAATASRPTRLPKYTLR